MYTKPRPLVAVLMGYHQFVLSHSAIHSATNGRGFVYLMPSSDLIIVVHGFACRPFVMVPLCWRLKRKGYRVDNWGYRSLFGNVEKHAARLHEHLTTTLSHEPRIHIVAHSMGTIVTRAALSMNTASKISAESSSIPNLGRVVLLAPPNQGSPMARRARTTLGRVCRTVVDLSDTENSFVNQLPTLSSIEIGIIAAKYDVLVPAANTHLSGEKEHRTLSATHNSLLASKTVVEMVHSFIESGKFKT